MNLIFDKERNKYLMDEYFVGIDPSFSGTGCIVIDKDGKILKQELISTKHNSANIYDIETRILEITKKIDFLKDIKDKIKHVYIEEISFGSSGEGSEQLASLNYFIRIFLFQNGFEYYTISPGKLKKYITSNGQAKKNLMLKEVYKRWGADFNDDNLADAYSLARYALDNFNKGILDVNIKKIKKSKKTN